MAKGIDIQEMARRNRAVVLQLIRDTEGISRTELADRVGFSRPALTKIAAQLLEMGLVTEQPAPGQSMGRPRSLLRINADWGRVVTLSLGHTFVLGTVDFAGSLRRHEVMASDRLTHGDYRQRFEDLVPGAICRWVNEERETGRVIGIGVVSGGRVDRHGVIRRQGDMPWEDVDLASILEPETGVPVNVDEEFRLLLAEERRQRGPGAWRNAVLMSGRLFGFGGGHAVMIDGRILYGHSGLAGQPGILAPVLHGEKEASEGMSRVKAMGGEDAYLGLVQRGDPAVADLFTMAVENYGYRLAQIANSYDPEIILIGAPYNCCGNAFLSRVESVMRAHTDASIMEDVKLQFAAPRDDVRRLKAAAMPLLSGDHSERLFTATEEAIGAELSSE